MRRGQNTIVARRALDATASCKKSLRKSAIQRLQVEKCGASGRRQADQDAGRLPGVPDGYLVVLIITTGAELAARHYLVSEGVADEIIFETVKNHDLPSCVIKGGVHRLRDSPAEYAG